MWALSKKTAIYKPGRDVSPEIDRVSTLILDFPPPEPWEINVCSLSLPVSAQADWDTIIISK